ncbi:MAG: radical SAM protein [Anaerolineae bacterium]|nr:radical SAM protein [Anaerolineae bacterium]
METLSWIEIHRNVFFVFDNFGKGLVYAPLLGKIFSADGESQSVVHEYVDSKNPSKHAFHKVLAEAGMLNQADEPEIPEKTPYNPTKVMLSLSNLCNLRCVYCYAETGTSSQILPWRIITQTIDQIFNNAIEYNIDNVEICFHGTGETLVQWNTFRKTVDYALSVKPSFIETNFALVTNGTLIDYEKAIFLADHNFFVSVSMDGVQSIQNKQRPFANGRGSYEEVVKGIKALVNAEVPFVVRSTITGENLEYMPEFIRLCAELGCRQISFMPFSAVGRGAKGVPSLQPRSFVENYRKSKRLAKEFNIDLSMAGTEVNKINSYYCGAIGINCAITPDGYISTCSRVTKTDDPLAPIFVIGKVSRAGFIINQDQLDPLTNLNLFSCQGCEKCFAKYTCSGGCPHDRLSFGNAMPEYWCEIVRYLIWDEIRDLAISK